MAGACTTNEEKRKPKNNVVEINTGKILKSQQVLMETTQEKNKWRLMSMNVRAYIDEH